MTRRNMLRIIYGLGWAAYTIYSAWFGFRALPDFMGGAGMAAFPPEFMAFFAVCGFLAYLQIGAPLAYLTFRPMWWGKLVMLLFCLSWLMFWPISALLNQFDTAHFRDLTLAAGLCSNVMFALAIAQQIVDPSLWRPFSQWGGNYPPPRSKPAQHSSPA
jgi:hypothetical protein